MLCHRFLGSLVVLALVAPVSCGFPLSDGARDVFARATICPPERVRVVPKEAYKTVVSAPEPSPPPEVAADPERLRYWNEQRAAERRAAEAQATTPVPDVYEVSGCGQTQLLVCAHPMHPGGKQDSTTAVCSDARASGISAR
jgi:hypothetical protein